MLDSVWAFSGTLTPWPRLLCSLLFPDTITDVYKGKYCLQPHHNSASGRKTWAFDVGCYGSFLSLMVLSHGRWLSSLQDLTSSFITRKKSKCKAVIRIGFKKQYVISLNTGNIFCKLSWADEFFNKYAVCWKTWKSDQHFTPRCIIVTQPLGFTVWYLLLLERWRLLFFWIFKQLMFLAGTCGTS